MGAADELIGHFETCAPIHLQTKLRQLDGDVRVYLTPRYFLEHLDVSVAGALRLIHSNGMLAENVKGRADAFFVECGNEAKRLVSCFSGDVSVGYSSNNAFGNRRERAGNHSIQQGHRAYTSGVMKKLLVLAAFLVVSASQAVSDVTDKTA